MCTCSSRLPASRQTYSRERLLVIGSTGFIDLKPEYVEELRGFGLLQRTTAPPTPTAAPRPQWRRHRRCERRQKRGKRGGIRARLTASPNKPAIPSILLANVRSLDNKQDHIQLLRSTQQTVRECCVFVFTESWLHDGIPDSAIQLDRLTCYRSDRAPTEGGKTRGGGVCVYIKDAWCQDTVVIRNTAQPWWSTCSLSVGLSTCRGSLQPSC